MTNSSSDTATIQTPEQTTHRPRRRLIHIKGDGQDVYRAANRFNAHATVTVAGEGADAPETFHDPAVILTVDTRGGWTVGVRPADGWSIEPTPVAYGHVDDVPAPAIATEPAATVLVWVVEGEICTGTVEDFARVLHSAQYGEIGAPRVVYVPTQYGDMVPVPFKVTRSDWDGNDTALATVVVTLTHGVEVESSWTVDGRG